MRRIRSRRLRVTWYIIKICILLLMAGTLGLLAATFYSVSKVIPTHEDIDAWVPKEATLIYSSDGVLLAQVYEENREPVPITEIPKQLQDATVAIEDSRFYMHSGVDLRGIVRALVENVRGGRVMQGGSTLTQQLARNIYLSHRRTVSRKLQEILLAREIERRLSKEEILERYLNQVYYGSGAYGVKAAARTYFGKLPSKLTLAECALIAGLPKKPSGWSPYDDKEAAIRRRNVVLTRMAELGYITREQAAEAKEEKVRLVGIQYGRARVKRAPHFVDYVLKQLVDKWGPDEVYRGGLRVETTLNLQMQEAAEKALIREVQRARREGKKVGQGAVVAVDPHTGHIKVMVGSLDYRDPKGGMYNRAAQGRGRQPGSAFKPFVYTAAIDSGYSPNFILQDTPISFPDGDKVWAPRNYDGKFRGPVTIRQAVEQSINVPAIRMLQMVGVDRVIAYAQRMGIRSPLERNLSLAIGTSEVTPLELASAYGCFATGGMYAKPMAILRVTGRNDRVMEDHRPSLTRAIPYETARTMADILRGVVSRGTGRRAHVIPGAGGKTGTTQDLRDAWFVGFTKDLSAAVWVGNDDYTPMGPATFGGTTCAPVWVGLMQTALPIIARHQRARPKTDIARREAQERPETTPEERQRIRQEIEQNTVFRVVCLESEQLAAQQCPRRKRVGFPRGFEPTEMCVLHGTGTDDAGVQEAPVDPEPERPSGHEPMPLDSGGAPSRPVSPERPERPSEGSPAAHGNRPSSGTAGRPATGSPAGAQARIEEVTICTSSNRRATEYCPEVEVKKVPENQIPGACTLHGASAGADGGTQ